MVAPRDPRPYIVAALVVAVVALAAYEATNVPGPASSSGLPTRFTVNGKSFPITYTATDSAERARGLMDTSITNSTTMLFVFPSPGTYSFWMLDTNSSLDIIWIDASGGSGTVVYIVEGAASCYLPILCTTYTPSGPANYVVEAKAGFAVANGIEVGTAVSFS